MTSSREQTVRNSEVTSEGTFPNTAESTALGDASDPSQGPRSVTREVSILPLQEEGFCEQGPQSQVMIDMLTDNVLLEIFDFYRVDPISHISTGFTTGNTWRWKTLTQVCRRWRYVIFGSPRRLDLRLLCTDTTPTKTSLDVWPPFPISIFCRQRVGKKGVENVIAAVERHDRTFQFFIQDIDGSSLEKLVGAMQKPHPTLTRFWLGSTDESVAAPPETFLGGSAPRLEFFALWGIPFPTFPKFILSATRIVYLLLYDIPDSGYISPDALVTCLAAAPNLKSVCFHFRSPFPPHPLQIRPPHLTRAVLPALSSISFGGASEYFEDFVARIDTPLLHDLIVAFFMDLIFDIPQLRHFIERAERYKPFNQAYMELSGHMINVVLGSPAQLRFKLEIECEPDFQLLLMTQILRQQLPLLSDVKQLEICQPSWDIRENIEWKYNPDMESSRWLELFRQFVAVQNLWVSEGLVPPVAAALQGLTGEMTMEVLPVLHKLSLRGLQPSGPVEEGLKSFVATRQLTDRPVAIQSRE